MKHIISTLAIVIFAFHVAFASQHEKQDLLMHLTTHPQWHAAFKQQTHAIDDSLNQTTYGIISMQQHQALRWENKKPHHQIILVTQKEIKWLDPDLKQVRISAVHAKHQTQILSQWLLNPTMQALQHWHVASQAPHQFTITPAAHDKNSPLKKIVIQFDAHHSIQSITCQQSMDQTLQIVFTHMGAVLPKNAFDVSIPKH